MSFAPLAQAKWRAVLNRDQTEVSGAWIATCGDYNFSEVILQKGQTISFLLPYINFSLILMISLARM